MWGRESHRLALLEFWKSGKLRRRKSNAEAWDELSRLHWARRTSRRDELELVSEHRALLEELLNRCWVGWRVVAAMLEERGYEADLRGWRQLRDAEREAALPSAIPDRLNRRTAAAAIAEHSKATITQRHLEALRKPQVTQDGVVRLRPSAGLRIRRGVRTHDAAELAALLGEVVISERAFRDGTVIEGERPEALMLVENSGSYIDVTPPQGWLVAQVPGWNTATVRLLFDQLDGIPVAHFGDLDPNGFEIVQHLQRLNAGLTWIVPDFWKEYVATRGLSKPWPDDLDVTFAPTWVREELVAKGRWLEQEVITLDPRLQGALVAALHTRRASK